MAEFALAVTGVVIAAPGVVDLLVKYGRWLSGRVQATKHASRVWEELAQMGESLSSGQLKLYAEQAVEAYKIPGLDPSLKKSLADRIQKFVSDLETTRKVLEETKPKGALSKAFFSLSGEAKAKDALKVLQPHEQGLLNLLVLIDRSKPLIEKRMLLSNDRFAIDKSLGYTPVSFTSTLFLAPAAFKETTQARKEELYVLIERQVDPETVTEKELKDITDSLGYRIQNNFLHPGVLRCLGYRMSPEPELIFELPGDLQVQTLQTLIAADVGRGYGGGHPLDHRLRLARQVSLAVLTVHTAGLVHKNIRSETIVVMKAHDRPSDNIHNHTLGFGDPYLTEWRLLRDSKALSTHRFITSPWWESIYRHPERQKLGRQEDYNMGHDIYSLGVCLLEIGLWDPLIRTRTASGQPEPSELFKKGAMLSDFATVRDIQNVFMNAPRVKGILISLAEGYLPSRMGLAYTRLTIACLKVLDTPSGLSPDIEDFRNLSDMEKGLAFEQLIFFGFSLDFN